MPKQVARKMPPPLPKGEVVIDAIEKRKWTVGSSIGKGGFGEIYTASKHGSSSGGNAEFVIKIVSLDFTCSRVCIY